FKLLGAQGERGLDGLRRGAERLGEELRIGVMEPVQAITEALRLGADERTAVDVARAALQEQALGGLRWADAIQKSAKVVRGFGPEFADQAQVIAMFGKASRDARVDLAGLIDSMGAIGPTAQRLRITFGEIFTLSQTAMAKGLKAEAI